MNLKNAHPGKVTFYSHLKVNPDKFGIHLQQLMKKTAVGIVMKFSIQSISKALTVALAFFWMRKYGRMGVEPSRKCF
jgi:glutaminase